jgi:diaminohydroxyphosphoribosylaminopyrimidine deaminase / 5-amino-6-(5-phosphoribosylamino)uracil reductase
MARAMQLARQGLYTSHPNPRVGCVLVKDNKIIGEGSHIQTGKEHAEINALKQVGDHARGATCYVTLEPCVHTGKTPPCTQGLISAGLGQVVASMVDPNPMVYGNGLIKLKEHGINTSIGLLETEAKEINKGYVKRMSTGIPYIRCKLAISTDGKTALASGESKWITNDQARNDVQIFRAESSALLTGIGTILSDDPRLTVREIELHGRIPLRVVIDRQLDIPLNAELFKHPGKVIIFTSSDKHEKISKLGDMDVDVLSPDTGVDFLSSSMKILAKEYHVNDILVEAGATLSGALLNNHLVDEFILYQAPIILGDKGRAMVNIGDIEKMNNKIILKLNEIRNIGDDIRMTYQVCNSSQLK